MHSALDGTDSRGNAGLAVDVLTIVPEDMTLFAAASLDVNPLHVSAAYARRTPFGEPVVYGILASLASMQYLPERPQQTLASIALDFKAPLFVGVEYQVMVSSEAADCSRIDIYDGTRVILHATCLFRNGGSAVDVGAPRATGRGKPATWDYDAIASGLEVDGSYAPCGDEMQRLIDRWRLHRRGL